MEQHILIGCAPGGGANPPFTRAAGEYYPTAPDTLTPPTGMAVCDFTQDQIDPLPGQPNNVENMMVTIQFFADYCDDVVLTCGSGYYDVKYRVDVRGIDTARTKQCSGVPPGTASWLTSSTFASWTEYFANTSTLVISAGVFTYNGAVVAGPPASMTT